MAKIRGPKPKPTALKRLAGNPGNRPLNDREPDIPMGVPECPDHLNAEARAEWERVVPILEAAGTITELDLAALVNYCLWWAIEQDAARGVEKYGALYMSKQKQPYQSPYLGVLSNASKQVHTWATELGMTPSSRSRVKTVEPSPDADPLTALLRQAGGFN